MLGTFDSCKSLLCDQEVRTILSWAIEKNIFIAAAHNPGISNVVADQESRKSELRTEWKLHKSVFGYIKKYLDFYPSVYLFASTTSLIIFWDFLMFYQIFFSPQVKQWTIITYKHGTYWLPQKLPNDLRLRILGN